MNYIEDCLEKFNNLPKELRDFLSSEKVVDVLEKIEQDFGVDVSFSIVLLFINEISLEDLPIYLKKQYELEEGDISQILFRMENDIFMEITDSFSDLEEPEKDYLLDLSTEEKKALLLDIFSEKILDQFAISEEHLFRLNAIIFESIGKDELFLGRLINAFLANQEEISSGDINIKGRDESPTIANWIKDFISEQGGDIFSAVDLAKYLTAGKNPAKLKEDEKQVLRQILKIYKNLSFFPDSMGTAPYRDWEIFPINRDLLSIYGDKIRDRKKISPPTDTKNIKTEEEVKTEDKQEEVVVEPEKKEELITENDKEIEDFAEKKEDDLPDEDENEEVKKLKEMLKNYPERSIERKAIENEIRKIQGV
jgi:hypothetical protein